MGTGRNLCIATLMGLILMTVVLSFFTCAQKSDPPSIIVTDMTFSDPSPTEGSNIIIYVTIHNNDPQAHRNISLAIAYGLNNITIYNGLELAVNETLTLDTNWTPIHGDHVITATPSIDGVVLTNQILRKDISVASKPAPAATYRSEYFALALVAILAFMSPLLAKRIRAPVVVVELIFGMTIGGIVAILKWLNWHPPWAPDTEFSIFGTLDHPLVALQFLANLGFIILLFLAGLEFDFQVLQERGKGSVLKGIGIFVLTYAIGIALMIPLGMGIGQAGIFLVGLTISTTFVGIVATTLREIGLADMGYRQNIIIMALMADIAVTIMLVLVPLVAKADLFQMALNLGIYIPVTFLIFYIAYRLGSMAMWHFPKTLSRFFHGKDPSELGVRASFMFLFFFILLTLFFGIEAILGAFLAGMLFSLLFHEGALLSKKLFGLGYGFFVPVFFIYIGSNFDFTLLWRPELLWMVPYIILVAILNKVLPSLIFLREYKIKKVLGIGILNSSRLAVMIAAVTIGIRYGLVNSNLLSPMILVAMVLCLLCPTAFKSMMTNEPKEKGFEEARSNVTEGRTGAHHEDKAIEEVL